MSDLRPPPLTIRVLAALTGGVLAFAPGALSQTSPATSTLPASLAAEIDHCVQEVLERVEAPGASIAIVRDGQIAYLKAYGRARLSPEVPATVNTRYGIASVSKQFTAAAILLLAQDGKLTLDDPVRKYLDRLPSGDNVTIRQLLNHTSGYRDYWPQDYVPPFMQKPVTPAEILDRWVRVPPDFAAGAEFQYSNSNYTAAGQIVEKVSGRPLMQFLRERIFEPLQMTRVDEDDTKALEPPDAAGYTRAGLGPVRPAPKEAAGWLYAAGQLAMPPRDLALWNISLIERKLLSPDSYQAMFQSNLGVFVKDDSGRRMVRHDGQISGTTTENRVWPDQGTAVSVMVNADWGALPGTIADRISHIIFPPSGPQGDALAFFVALQRGVIDPAKLTPNGQSFFTPEVLSDSATGLGKLGPVRLFRRTSENRRGGLIHCKYQFVCANGAVSASVFTTLDGRFEQFAISPVIN